MLYCLLVLLLTCDRTRGDGATFDDSYDTGNVSLPPDRLDEEGNVAVDETTNITVLLEKTFPFPSINLTEMVNAAKDFVHKYLSVAEWLNMKKLLRVIKEIGGNQRDAQRAISIYLGRVLSPEKRREIEDRKEELEATFTGDFRR